MQFHSFNSNQLIRLYLHIQYISNIHNTHTYPVCPAPSFYITHTMNKTSPLNKTKSTLVQYNSIIAHNIHQKEKQKQKELEVYSNITSSDVKLNSNKLNNTRAKILARLINSLSMYRIQQSYSKIKSFSNLLKNRYTRLGLAINRIFRRNFYQDKFNSMQKIKKQLILNEAHLIDYNQKIVQSMMNGSKKIICLLLKIKRREVLMETFQKIRLYGLYTNFQTKASKRKSIKKLLQILIKNKKYTFDRIYNTRCIIEKKQKLRSMVHLFNSHRKQAYKWSFWKLRKNLIVQRKKQVEQDIKIFQTKINNTHDPELQAIKQKKDKLEQHLSKVQQQKNAIEQQYSNQYQQMENHRKQLQDNIKSLQDKKLSLQNSIAEVQNSINMPYSLDQIYQCVYYNFLLFLHQNNEKVYNKEEVLKSLTYPLIPIDVPIDTIKQQNKAMQELLNEYMIMFGPKKLEKEIHLPCQYLVRENHVMYKMLLSILPEVEADRDDLRVIRDNLFKLNATVGETWSKLAH